MVRVAEVGERLQCGGSTVVRSDRRGWRWDFWPGVRGDALASLRRRISPRAPAVSRTHRWGESVVRRPAPWDISRAHRSARHTAPKSPPRVQQIRVCTKFIATTATATAAKDVRKRTGRGIYQLFVIEPHTRSPTHLGRSYCAVQLRHTHTRRRQFPRVYPGMILW